jgi:hypothetical protein
VRRIVILALTVSLPVAIAVFVPVWRYGVMKGPGTYIGGQHPPTTPEERAIAAVGLSYVRAAQRGDPGAACYVAVRKAARRLRCGDRPRLPRDLKPGGGRLTAVEAIVTKSRATIGISDGSDELNVLQLHRWHGIWRVAEHGRGRTY